jgi:hypothetical protein
LVLLTGALRRIGVMRALNRHVVRELNPDQKDTHRASGSWRAIGEGKMPHLFRRTLPPLCPTRPLLDPIGKRV